MEANVLTRFLDSNNKLLVNELIEYFEEDLLNHDRFPDDYLVFLKYVYSNAEFFGIKNLWKVLHTLTTENLDKEQFHDLSLTLAKNFGLFHEYMLCDMACDFIARCCEPMFALNLLDQMSKNDIDGIHKSAILVGLNILLTSKCEDAECNKRVKELADKVSL